MAASDPYRNFRFKVITGEVIAGHFTEVSGIGVSVEAIAYREGGDSGYVRKLPGRFNCSDVSFSYGVSESDEMWAWLMRTVQGAYEPKNISVVVPNATGQTEAMRLNLINAWVRECRFAPFNAMSNLVLIETMVCAVESVERA